MRNLPPVTGIEGLNPTRRYQWFRPRQAVRGAVDYTSGVGSYCTLGVYNNSAAAKILIVRDWEIFSAAVGSGAGGFFMNNANGGANGSSFVENYSKQSATLPGIMVSYSAGSSQFPSQWTNQFQVGQQLIWYHDYPFAMVEPGWALLWQAATTNSTNGLSLIWEVIDPDELDYLT